MFTHRIDFEHAEGQLTGQELRPFSRRSHTALPAVNGFFLSRIGYFVTLCV